MNVNAVTVMSELSRRVIAGRLDRIFDPYQSFQRTGQRGTGLGLYISRGIVLRHGGRLTVQSGVGTGSAFTITLPRIHD